MIDIIYRFVPEFRHEQPAPADAEEARHRLEAGNRAFAELLTAAPGGKVGEPRIIPFDLRELGIAEDAGEAPAQAPFALVLGCSDARVPTELIFSQACNDLFVVRVAGNVLGNRWYGYRVGGWGGPQTYVRDYDEGTLLIDVIDPATMQLLWRGSGTGVVDPQASPEKREQRINEAVEQILADFPPRS